MIRTATTLFLILGLSACQTLPQNNQKTLAERYMLAVEDASVVTPDEISNNLIPIRPDNPDLVWQDINKTKLKVVTWKSASSYAQNMGCPKDTESNQKIENATCSPERTTSNDEKYVIWVTSAPQIKNFCTNYMQQNPSASADDLDLRLKQYLGLNQNWEYDLFIELWVNPDDLFRPCVDTEIDDSSCNLVFDDTSIPTVPGIANYKAFYQNLYFNGFRSRQAGSATPGVPWTGLGYTYDWGNPTTPVGASEFIITTNAPYEIATATSTIQYCQGAMP